MSLTESWPCYDPQKYLQVWRNLEASISRALQEKPPLRFELAASHSFLNHDPEVLRRLDLLLGATDTHWESLELGRNEEIDLAFARDSLRERPQFVSYPDSPGRTTAQKIMGLPHPTPLPPPPPPPGQISPFYEHARVEVGLFGKRLQELVRGAQTTSMAFKRIPLVGHPDFGQIPNLHTGDCRGWAGRSMEAFTAGQKWGELKQLLAGVMEFLSRTAQSTIDALAETKGDAARALALHFDEARRAARNLPAIVIGGSSAVVLLIGVNLLFRNKTRSDSLARMA